MVLLAKPKKAIAFLFGAAAMREDGTVAGRVSLLETMKQSEKKQGEKAATPGVVVVPPPPPVVQAPLVQAPPAPPVVHVVPPPPHVVHVPPPPPVVHVRPRPVIHVPPPRPVHVHHPHPHHHHPHENVGPEVCGRIFNGFPDYCEFTGREKGGEWKRRAVPHLTPATHMRLRAQHRLEADLRAAHELFSRCCEEIVERGPPEIVERGPPSASCGR